jgi:hypothetical protein
MMSAEIRTQRFPERTIRQVRLDCNRAMARAKFCADQSEIAQLRCVDDRPETEQGFGRQLWYFEGLGVDARDRRHRLFGVVEYSLQFGLHELIEDRVFDSDQQREQYRQVYKRGSQQSRWHHPANRWLLAGLLSVGAVWLSYLIWRMSWA